MCKIIDFDIAVVEMIDKRQIIFAISVADLTGSSDKLDFLSQLAIRAGIAGATVSTAAVIQPHSCDGFGIRFYLGLFA